MHPSSAPIEPDGMFDGLNPSAVLYGAAIDILATIVTSMLLIAVIGGPDVVSEDREQTRAAMQELLTSTGALWASLALGMGCTVLGAFVGARRAGALHLRHGGWVAVASTAFLALSLLFPEDPNATATPLWYEALSWVLILPAGLAGGALARFTQAQSA